MLKMASKKLENKIISSPTIFQNTKIAISRVINDENTRNMVMSHLLQDTECLESWIGSWSIVKHSSTEKSKVTVSEFNDIIKTIVPVNGCVGFILAEEKSMSSTHFNGFVVDVDNDTIYYSDPGRSVRSIGQNLASIVRSALQKATGYQFSIVDQTKCLKVSSRVSEVCLQCCTGDILCQTWSLFYVYYFLVNGEIEYDKFTNLQPNKRYYIFYNFIMRIFIELPGIHEYVAHSLIEIIKGDREKSPSDPESCRDDYDNILSELSITDSRFLKVLSAVDAFNIIKILGNNEEFYYY